MAPSTPGQMLPMLLLRQRDRANLLMVRAYHPPTICCVTASADQRFLFILLNLLVGNRSKHRNRLFYPRPGSLTTSRADANRKASGKRVADAWLAAYFFQAGQILYLCHIRERMGVAT